MAHWLQRAMAALGGVALLATLARFPLERSWLAAVLAGYGAVLCWRPRLWLLLLPALLPALDLAPVTGWFFIDESDLLLMLTVTVCYACPCRLAPPGAAVADQPRLPAGMIAWLLLLALAWSIGLWRGVRSWPPVDPNAFNNYLSPYNGLRIAKAWGWAMLLWMPLRRTAGPQLQGLARGFVPGMLAGLALVVLADVRERAWFPGLMDFSTDYRTTAPFSAMHTGGAALDGYLALCAPLLALHLGTRRGGWHPWLMLPLLAGTAYASLTTFSRGLYLALALALLVLLAGRLAGPGKLRPGPALCGAGAIASYIYLCDRAFAAGGYRALAVLLGTSALVLLLYVHAGAPRPLAAGAPPAPVPRRLPVPLSLALAGLMLIGLAVPIGNSYYAAERFATSAGDWQRRLTHWRHALSMMDDDALAPWLGMGLGTFPATYFWHNPAREQPASYQFIDQPGNRYLQLAAPGYAAGYGELLRMLQRVDVAPHTPYALQLDVRNPGPPAFLRLNLCARLLLYPDDCVPAPMPLIATGDSWRHYQFLLHSGALGAGPRYWRRPVQLELALEGQNATMAVDNVSLRDAITERELLRNGSFTDGNNYWFFSSDRHHLPWHTKNLALNLYFELGWLGLTAYTGLLACVCAGLVRRLLHGERDAAAWLASLTGFHAVGLFDSLLDVPRIALLSMLLLCAGALRPARPAGARP